MNEDDVNLITSKLSELPQGYLPEPIFNEIARLATLTAIEFIPFRKNGDAIELLVFRRSPQDKFWPNALHTPGTILRASDASFEDAYNRLFKDELKCEPLPVQFIGNDFMQMNRGRIVLFKYVIDVTDIQTDGEFYDINALPDDLLAEHRDMALDAVSHFRK